MTTTTDTITNIAVVNEFIIEADDYHQFYDITSTLSKTVGLIYKHKEIDPIPSSKAYRAVFTFQGIRHPAQYSKDIE